jgi:hypothetical protein
MDPMYPAAQAPERWWSKRELARHYGFSVRWVESMLGRGMPSRLIGGQRRFLLSQVDPWLEQLGESG